MDQPTRKYEMIVVANANLDEEALAAFNQRVANWITASGGTVDNTNVWGRRQLAYQIGKHTHAFYIQYDFQMVPSATRELERSLRIDENVVRYLVVRCDE